LLFYPSNEICAERTYDDFMLRSTTYGWPEFMTGRDGVRILFIGRESAVTVSNLPLGNMYIPKNQKVVFQLNPRFLPSPSRSALYSEILPSKFNTRWSTQSGATQESTDLRALKLAASVHRRDRILVIKQNLVPPKTLADIPGPEFVCVCMPMPNRHGEIRVPPAILDGSTARRGANRTLRNCGGTQRRACVNLRM